MEPLMGTIQSLPNVFISILRSCHSELVTDATTQLKWPLGWLDTTRFGTTRCSCTGQKEKAVSRERRAEKTRARQGQRGSGDERKPMQTMLMCEATAWQRFPVMGTCQLTRWSTISALS